MKGPTISADFLAAIAAAALGTDKRGLDISFQNGNDDAMRFVNRKSGSRESYQPFNSYRRH